MKNIKIDEILHNLDKIANLPRHLISDGYDEALEIIMDVAKDKGLKHKVHSYQTGHDCGTWIIPEKWKLKKAQLRDMSGTILIDAAREPLACVSYSLPFEGKISKAELIKHLHVSEHCPNAIPFVFKYFEKDWGFCCTKEFKNNLIENEYLVSIDTEFISGELKVGEIIVEGKFDESFVIASHLCHPCQVNDGPIGIFPTLEIMSYLKNYGSNYTYRQLIVPENIGSAAWLSENADLIPELKGGIFVELIGTDMPLCLNKSFSGNTIVDEMFADIVHNHSKEFFVEPFIHANDERQFNGPGVMVPMVGLNRMTPNKNGFSAFPFYHTNKDVMENINIPNFSESLAVLSKMVLDFDLFLVKPEAHFIGEPCLSRYGLHIDAFESLEQCDQNVEMMDILFMVGDGSLTIYEIGKKLGLSPGFVKQILDKFVEKDLISYKPLK